MIMVLLSIQQVIVVAISVSIGTLTLAILYPPKIKPGLKNIYQALISRYTGICTLSDFPDVSTKKLEDLRKLEERAGRAVRLEPYSEDLQNTPTEVSSSTESSEGPPLFTVWKVVSNLQGGVSTGKRHDQLLNLAVGFKEAKRMFPDVSGFQVLCKACHDSKTKRENEERRANKKRSKARPRQADVEPLAMESSGRIGQSSNVWSKEVLTEWVAFCPNAQERYTAALLRHLYALNAGERIDPESGLRHIDHVLCNAAFLSELDDE
ncbi:unnamed protein product [Sphagnum balticum]